MSINLFALFKAAGSCASARAPRAASDALAKYTAQLVGMKHLSSFGAAATSFVTNMFLEDECAAPEARSRTCWGTLEEGKARRELET